MIRKISALLTALLLVASLPLAVFAEPWYLEDGDITISANESGQTVSQGTKTNVIDNNPTITQKDDSTTTDNTITIKTADNATANVTIEDVNISANKPGIEVGGSNLNLTVEGENKIKNNDCGMGGTAGVHLDYKGNLTITGDGNLDVEACGWYSAGIGTNGSEGLITGSITIAGNAQVSGTSWGNGAGIGTGNKGKMAGSITIADNAQVTGTSERGGAGIGSGVRGEMSGTITIDDTAHVTACANPGPADALGAGIGSGSYGTMSGTISISDKATVNASSIGAGKDGPKTGTITYFEPQPKPTQPEPTQPETNGAVIYQVVNENGVSIGYKSELKDGVLTITVKGDYARLTGSVATLKTLASWGWTAITLVTDNATSTVTLADLQAKGTGTYALTHSGQEATLTLNGEALADILK